MKHSFELGLILSVEPEAVFKEDCLQNVSMKNFLAMSMGATCPRDFCCCAWQSEYLVLLLTTPVLFHSSGCMDNVHQL